jgi:hypothetical protein
MIVIYRALLGALALCYAMSCAAAEAHVPAHAPPIRILFIGNSYTYYNDMPLLIEDLASESGVERAVETETIAFGGATLKDHWNKGQAQKEIARRHWDVVVLQENSLMPMRDVEQTRKYLRLFNEKIRDSGAKTMLYLVWSRAYGPRTQAAVSAVYESLAQELHVSIAPVGPAWQMARRERPALRLYESEAGLPTLAGSYLAAYVLHIALFGKAPEAGFVPEGLTAAEHAVLLDAAMKASLSMFMWWHTTASTSMDRPVAMR